VEFIKITAQGNDYIYIDTRKYPIKEETRSDLARRLSDRHFGIGSDGVVFLEASEESDIRMKMYNADGSVGKMCGNAFRSVVYLLTQEKKQEKYLVDTDSGKRSGWLETEPDIVTVSMGNIEQFDQTDDSEGSVFLVGIGNRHLVRIVEDLPAINVEEEVKLYRQEMAETDLNYEFVGVIGEDSLRIIIYENGSGLTLACGTGAVASAYTCRQEGLVSGDRIKVMMPGGEVIVELGGDEIFLSGRVQEVFRGSIEI